jgi:hypothetical protein
MTVSRHRRNQLAAIALIAATGFARLPLEQHISDDFRSRGLLPEKINAGLREQVGQGALLAVMGGMRSAVASARELQAFAEFVRQPPAWHKVDQHYAVCTLLQPRDPHYWEYHAWMLASNAAEFYAVDGGATGGLEQPIRQFYRRKGLEIAEKGMRYCPNAYSLYQFAAMLLSWPSRELNPQPDHVRAAEYYRLASLCPGAPRYLHRSYVYELSRIRGRENEAYKLLRQLYDNGGLDLQPTVISRLIRMETILRLSRDQWIPEHREAESRQALTATPAQSAWRWLRW